jgi:hypothetical protein
LRQSQKLDASRSSLKGEQEREPFRPWPSGDHRSGLCLNDLHLLCVHTSAVNFELGQSAVDLLQIRCRQLDLGSFDVLLQMLDLSGARNRNDERLLGKQPGKRELGGSRLLLLRKLGNAFEARRRRVASESL